MLRLSVSAMQRLEIQSPELDLEEGEKPPQPVSTAQIIVEDNRLRSRKHGGRQLIACPYCGPGNYLDENGNCSTCRRTVPTI